MKITNTPPVIGKKYLVPCIKEDEVFVPILLPFRIYPKATFAHPDFRFVDEEMYFAMQFQIFQVLKRQHITDLVKPLDDRMLPNIYWKELTMQREMPIQRYNLEKDLFQQEFIGEKAVCKHCFNCNFYLPTVRKHQVAGKQYTVCPQCGLVYDEKYVVRGIAPWWNDEHLRIEL
ncbi:MAG: hypothetical protein AAF738_03945 [Bacteroidota bacterium]